MKLEVEILAKESLLKLPFPSSQVSVESNMDTLYWCKIFKAPTLHEKHHIIGYEAILSKEG